MQSNNNEQENMTQDSRNGQERKILYRELLTEVEEISESEDVGLKVVKHIGKILKVVNSLENESEAEERVENAEETLLDSMVLSSASGVLVKCIKAIDVSTTAYDPVETARKILEYVGNAEDPDLSVLSKFSEKIFVEVPKCPSLYSIIDLDVRPQDKPIKKKPKIMREKLEKKEPEKVINIQKEEDGIKEIVKNIYDVLLEQYQKNNQNPIDYHTFITDTESFGKTVENVFYCSFLIRDGRALIDFDQNEIPRIKPLHKSQFRAHKNSGGPNLQAISPISMGEWKKWKGPGFIQKCLNTKK